MATIEPDTKDWTWVLEHPCPECGFEAARVAPGDLAGALRESSGAWAAALAAPGVGIRRDPGVWSVLEYACHVRDVHEVMGQRLALMLDEDEPIFPSWDQDAAAVSERYAEQDPETVGRAVVQAAEIAADRYAGVVAEQWDRRGRRSNGSVFTVIGLGRYHLHDVVHHLHDVTTATGQG